MRETIASAVTRREGEEGEPGWQVGLVKTWGGGPTNGEVVTKEVVVTKEEVFQDHPKVSQDHLEVLDWEGGPDEREVWTEGEVQTKERFGLRERPNTRELQQTQNKLDFWIIWSSI